MERRRVPQTGVTATSFAGAYAPLSTELLRNALAMKDAPELRGFLQHLRLERGLAENTVRAYRRDLEHHIAWLDEHKIRFPGDVGSDPLASGPGSAQATS